MPPFDVVYVLVVEEVSSLCCDSLASVDPYLVTGIILISRGKKTLTGCLVKDDLVPGAAVRFCACL